MGEVAEAEAPAGADVFVPAAALATAVGEYFEAGLSGNWGVVKLPANVSADGCRPQLNILAPGIFQPLLHPTADTQTAISNGALHL